MLVNTFSYFLFIFSDARGIRGPQKSSPIMLLAIACRDFGSGRFAPLWEHTIVSSPPYFQIPHEFMYWRIMAAEARISYTIRLWKLSWNQRVIGLFYSLRQTNSLQIWYFGISYLHILRCPTTWLTLTVRDLVLFTMNILTRLLPFLQIVFSPPLGPLIFLHQLTLRHTSRCLNNEMWAVSQPRWPLNCKWLPKIMNMFFKLYPRLPFYKILSEWPHSVSF